ncbi:MAG: hypothetical protein RLY15_350, partial [Bacteroidota bacterium]
IPKQEERLIEEQVSVSFFKVFIRFICILLYQSIVQWTQKTQ